MLLVCPECRTRYVVPDSAIGGAGRQVRCASCRHSWFQEGPESVAPPPIEPVAPPPTAPPPPPAPPAAPKIERERAEETIDAAPAVAEAVPVTEPEASSSFAFSDPPPPPPMIDSALREVAAALPENSADNEYDDRSQFDHEPPFRPRRNPLKMLNYAAMAFALLVVVLGGALWASGWLKGGLEMKKKEPALKIVLSPNLELGRAASGTTFFIASGSIVNPTAEKIAVPDMLVTLKNAKGVSIYNWKMHAPTKSLGPGGKVDFSELKRDVPPAASRISVGWALD